MRLPESVLQENGNAVHFFQDGSHCVLVFLCLQGRVTCDGPDPIGLVGRQDLGSFSLGENGFRPRSSPLLGLWILNHHNGQMKANKEYASCHRGRRRCASITVGATRTHLSTNRRRPTKRFRHDGILFFWIWLQRDVALARNHLAPVFFVNLGAKRTKGNL